MTLAIIITVLNVVLFVVSLWILRGKERDEKFARHVVKENMKLVLENIDITLENRLLKDEFKNELYNGAFNEWEIVEDAECKRDFYLEKDGIRLIFDDKKCIGWYKPNTYEAPTAEIVQK